MADLIKIGALWQGVDRNGNTIYTGKMGDARLLILANGYKDSENQPDYIVYVTKNERDDTGTSVDPASGNVTEDIPFAPEGDW